MTDKKMREEFDAWRQSLTTEQTHIFNADGAGYPISTHRFIYMAWQAACASKQKEIDALNKLNQTLFTQIEQTNEYIRHTLNAVDNLNDMPISEGWAKKWVNGAIGILERNNYFRGLSLDSSEEKPPINPEEVWSPHTEVLK